MKIFAWKNTLLRSIAHALQLASCLMTSLVLTGGCHLRPGHFLDSKPSLKETEPFPSERKSSRGINQGLSQENSSETVPDLALASAENFSATSCYENLSLAQLLHLSLENNIATKKAWWQSQMAAAQEGISASSYYPKLDWQSKLTQAHSESFATGPNVTYTEGSTDFVLSMLLLDFGQRNEAFKAAKEALKAAKWQENWVLQGVMIETLKSSYQLLHAMQTLESAKVSYEDALALYHVVKEYHALGLSSITDVHMAESVRSQMAMELSKEQSSYDIKRSELAREIGLGLTTPLSLEPLNIDKAIEQASLNQLLKLAQEKRADLQQKRALKSSLEANYRSISASSGPKLGLNTTVGARDDFSNHDKSFEGRIFLQLDLPLFDGFSTTYRSRLAYAQMKALEEDIQSLEKEIDIDILSRSRQLQAYSEMLPEAISNVRNLQLVYEGTLERYRAGKQTIFDLSSSLKQLAIAREKESDIRMGLLISVASLAYASGTLSLKDLP